MFWDSQVLIVTDTVHANESLTLDLEKHKTQTVSFVSDLSYIVEAQKQSTLSQIYLVEVRNSQLCLRCIL